MSFRDEMRVNEREREAQRKRIINNNKKKEKLYYFNHL